MKQKQINQQHENIFNVGDVVQLKSGGHPMTVSSVDMYDTDWMARLLKSAPFLVITCEWFDKKEKRRTERFSPETLKKLL